MNTFYKKIAIFISLFTLLCIGLDYMSMHDPWRIVFARLTDSEEFISMNVGSDEIIPYIEQVQTKDNTTTLILGDSVCRQMFKGLQQYNEDICIAGSNATVTMAGQYILAEEYIRNHPNATNIYLMVHPTSLCGTFSTTFGYQYTVMPFVETNTLRLLNDNTIENMKSVYGDFFMKPQIVQLIEKSAINRKLYLNVLKKYKTGYEQKTTFEIADQYIRQIYELCEKNNIGFHLYACPVAESKYQIVKELQDDYDNTWMKTQFPNYFDNILFFPDEQSADGTHFSGEYESQTHYNEKISKILADTKLLDNLKLD